MSDQIVPIILSGGAGSRLWPASRRRQPKQLLPLVDDRSMLLITLQRISALPNTGMPMVVSNEDQRSGIQRELHRAGLSGSRIVLEPVGRNTAPALAVAALDLNGRGEDPLLLVLPADHIIQNQGALAEAVDAAAGLAEQGYLVTFGVTPTHPETGYGYIEVGTALGESAMTVSQFREKPDADTAARYLADGKHLWNSGMFMFRARRYLEELELHRPDVLTPAREALLGGKDDDGVVTLDAAAMAQAPSISIDYAVMESTKRAAVVPLNAGWTDVGSWEALWTLGQADSAGNVITGDAALIDVTNSFIRTHGRLIAAIGLDNIAIVDSPDATLIAARDRVQDVKEIVDRLSEERRREVETDGTEARPWGGFVTLLDLQGFRIVRLWIEPGARTSLQSHDHRIEHWIVIGGTAKVTIGGETRLVEAGDSAVAAAGAVHRIENPSDDVPLEVIEVDVTAEGDQ